MKALRVKLLLIVAFVTVATLSSCGSGWSCKKRYVDTNKPLVVKQHKPC